MDGPTLEGDIQAKRQALSSKGCHVLLAHHGGLICHKWNYLSLPWFVNYSYLTLLCHFICRQYGISHVEIMTCYMSIIIVSHFIGHQYIMSNCFSGLSIL